MSIAALLCCKCRFVSKNEKLGTFQFTNRHSATIRIKKLDFKHTGGQDLDNRSNLTRNESGGRFVLQQGDHIKCFDRRFLPELPIARSRFRMLRVKAVVAQFGDVDNSTLSVWEFHPVRQPTLYANCKYRSTET